MSKTKSRKAKSSARTKKSTSEKKNTPKHPNKWGVFINANHVSEPQEVKWDNELECYCTEEDTFTEPHGFVFDSYSGAHYFVQGAEAARNHIASMIGMMGTPELDEEYDDDAIHEEEEYESQK